jgi:hypothetical protein
MSDRRERVDPERVSSVVGGILLVLAAAIAAAPAVAEDDPPTVLPMVVGPAVVESRSPSGEAVFSQDAWRDVRSPIASTDDR